MTGAPQAGDKSPDISKTALRKLEQELDSNACIARVYLVAGRMMHVTYRRPAGPSKWAVFDLLMQDDEVLLSSARNASASLGLSEDWLQEIAHRASRDAGPSGIAPTVYDRPALVIGGAHESYVFVVKAHASRPCDRDDILWLMGRLGISGPEAAQDYHDSIFPTAMLDKEENQARAARLRGLCR